MERRRRHAGLALLLAASCLATNPHLNTDEAGWRALSLGLGYLSLALLVVTLALGPWTALLGRRVPSTTMVRRDLGIWCGLSALLHVVAAAHAYYDGWLARYFFSDPAQRVPDFSLFGLANRFGALAAILLLVLMVLSNNLAMRRLGLRRWKLIQRLTYLAGGLTFAHTLAYQVFERRGGLAESLLLTAVGTLLLLRGAALLESEPARKLATALAAVLAASPASALAGRFRSAAGQSD